MKSPLMITDQELIDGLLSLLKTKTENTECCCCKRIREKEKFESIERGGRALANLELAIEAREYREAHYAKKKEQEND